MLSECKNVYLLKEIRNRDLYPVNRRAVVVGISLRKLVVIHLKIRQV